MEQSVRHFRQKSLVLILAREFASNLATPIYIADSDECLVYFNEPAEQIAGQSFAETGEIPVREWAEMLTPQTADGQPLKREETPGGIAFTERRPAHGTLYIDRARRHQAGDRDHGVPAVRPGRRVPRDHGHLLGAGVGPRGASKDLGVPRLDGHAGA